MLSDATTFFDEASDLLARRSQRPAPAVENWRCVQARQFLEQARTLWHAREQRRLDLEGAREAAAAEHESEEVGSAARTSGSETTYNIDVAVAREVLDAGARVIARHIDRALARADRALVPVRGLPPPLDTFRILNVQARESSFQSVLAWLLDRHGSHGMGDVLLRRLLGILGLTLRGRLFSLARPLDVSVCREFQWSTPPGYLERIVGEASRSASALRIDILLVSPGTWLAIECKAKAEQSKYQLASVEYEQGAAYRHALLHALGRTLPDASSWAEPLKESIHRSGRQRFGQNTWSRVSNPTRVLSCIVDTDVMLPRKELGPGVRHLNWASVARAASRVADERRVPEAVRWMIDDFFAASCRLSTGGDLMSTIEDIRLRVQSPELARRFPVRTYLELNRALDRLHEQIPSIN